MDNFELDRLKKTWQEHHVPQVYDSNQIMAMLNNKSRTYFKYILWISIAEFLVFILANIYTIFYSQNNNTFINIIGKLGVKSTPEIEMNFEHLYLGLKMISLAMTATFVYLFYKNYKKINIESNLKKFILQIIKFKKTVNAFILSNVILLLVFTVVLTGFTFYVLDNQNIEMNNNTFWGVVIVLVLMTLVSIGLILLYYRVVYGIIMSRLDKNLKQLKAIEKESLSLIAAGVRFNIPTISIILKWKNDFANFGIEGLQPKQKGRPISMSDKRKKNKSDKPLTREEELLKENERLRCENELLKKLHALIQARRNPKP